MAIFTRKKILSFLGFTAVLALAIFIRSPTISQNFFQSLSKSGDSYSQEAVIAIEFGDTFSRVGRRLEGKHELVLDNQGRSILPSYVAFKDGLSLVGFEAKEQSESNPQNTITNIRRLMGRDFSDASFKNDIKSLLYEVVEIDGRPAIKLQVDGSEQIHTPVEIAAKIFQKLKLLAENFFNSRVNDVVITVPSTFNDQQRQAVKDAAKLAGLITLRVINEPTAASIGHDLDLRESQFGQDETFVLTYNLEESNCDVTLSTIEDGVFEIMSSATDASVGTSALKDALLRHVIQRYEDKNDVEISNDPQLLENIKEGVKRAEDLLPIEKVAAIKVGDFTEIVTKAKLERLHQAVFDTTQTMLDKVLAEAKISKSRVDHIVVTGDPGALSKIEHHLVAYFDGKKPLANVRPDEAVLRGATRQAQILSFDEDPGCTFGLDLAMLNLGIGTSRGLFRSVIPRHTVVPTRKTVTISTIRDDQDKILLPILEGQRPIASKNNLIATLEITGITPAPKGVPQIEVSFEFDPNGVVTVLAQEQTEGQKGVSKREHKIVFSDPIFTKPWEGKGDEINAICMEAEKFSQDDLAAVAVIEQGGGMDSQFGCSAAPREVPYYYLEDSQGSWWIPSLFL